jgi:predicted amidohydrolase YtcJ
VASYNPFTALRWLLVDSENALRAYTIGSAWFSFDENIRGSLEPEKLADLAILTKDYMTVSPDQIGSIESLLTMVGGKIVYASGPYARLEQKFQRIKALN